MSSRLMRVLSTLVVLAITAALAAPVAAAPGRGHNKGPKKPPSHSQPVKSPKPVKGGTLVAMPPLSQPGTAPADPLSGGQIVATFSPARPGTAIRLERRGKWGWKQVAKSRQDGWGSAAFTVAPGKYRARTTGQSGRETVTRTITSRNWTPTFEDTFSGTHVDPQKWRDQKREHESEYARRTCARTDPGARTVADGALTLGITLDPERANRTCHYRSNEGNAQQSYLLTSQIATEDTHLFRYGIFAARMKPQRTRGMHSGFWLLPEGTVFKDGDPSAGTEVDIMEFFGESANGNDGICSFVYYYNPGWEPVKLGGLFKNARNALSPGAEWWDEYHVFSVEWTPEAYIFRVDGREYHRETNAISHVNQYLVLSMLASDYEIPNLNASNMTDTAQVDWVRVYDGRSTQR